MTWTKTPDDYPDRLLERSDAAYRLHHAATTYANRVGLDGRIPKTRLSLVPVPRKTRRKPVVDELVAAGLWPDDGDAWQLVGFFDDQPSAEEVRLTREYNTLRQRIRFAKKGPNGAKKQASFGPERDAVLAALQAARERRRAQSHTATHGATHMPPSRPVRDEDEERARPSVPLGGASAGPAMRAGVELTAGEAGMMADSCALCFGDLDSNEATVVDVYDGWDTPHRAHRWCDLWVRNNRRGYANDDALFDALSEARDERKASRRRPS
jgi:hypothetical protein